MSSRKKTFKMWASRLQAPFLTAVGTTRASQAAFFLMFIFAVSLPSKWATLHIAGLALVILAGFARRADWRTPAMQTYLLCTALWLVPVLLTAGFQHALGVATASEWSKLPMLVLRMFGVGLGIVILVLRGWLTLHSATVALLCALSIHAGAGLIEWIVAPNTNLETWRQLRISGLTKNPNPFGTFMALAAILSAGLLRDQLRRAALWVLLIVALLCVWGSGSRGAILVTVIGFAILFPPTNRQSFYFYGVAIAALIYGYTGMQFSSSGSDNERLQAFSFASEQIRLAPWIGWGIDAYGHLPGRIGPKAPHNMLLDLAVSSGLVALAGWMLSTAFLAHRLFRCAHPAAHLALAILAGTVLAGTLEYSILVSMHFQGIWIIVTTLACCTLGACATASTRAD